MTETRKLAAILVADIVGFSRLAGADEERTLARVRGLRSDLLEPTIAAHRGRVVKRTGDGSIVEFRSVVDAVRCAIEVQTGLIERNAGVPPERRIEYRVGIHLGDVVEESDGDLMGDGVNIAARLEGVAEPGAICLSEQAYWQVKSRLDLKVTDLGATRLKNIAEPIHVYSLQVGQQLARAMPAPSAAPSPEKPLHWAAPADQQAAIKRIQAKRGFKVHATVYVAVNLFLVAIWALTGPGSANHGDGSGSDFWPIWPILGWGVGLGAHYLTVFHRRPISADEIRREIEKGP
jgi:adenylate cyclase